MSEFRDEIAESHDRETNASAEAGVEGSVAALLVRTADCLKALMRSPTAASRLNESRYNVLDALRRMPDGTSTQSALAQALLQSESNLSTLLDRMQQDGLISRARSATDRRKTLIGLAAAGSDALLQADHERNRAATKILRSLDARHTQALFEALDLLLKRLELELGLGVRGRAEHSSPNRRDQSTGVVPPPHIRLIEASAVNTITPDSHGHKP
jgi:DNA-binding MarR family transcriptional regulator